MMWRTIGLLAGAVVFLTQRQVAAQDFKSSKLSPGVVVQGQTLQSPKLSTGIVMQGAGVQSTKLAPGVVVQGAGFVSPKISVGIVLQLMNPNGIVVRAPLTNW